MTSEEQFISALITSVEKHPVLYKVNLSDYKNKNKKGEAFKEVQREIREAGCSESQVQSTYKKWISLKRKFRVEYFRLKNEEKSEKCVLSGASNFRFFDSLTFLVPYCEFYESLKCAGKKRKHLDNFEMTNTTFNEDDSEDEQFVNHFDEDESYTPTTLDKLLMNKAKNIKLESAEESSIFPPQPCPSPSKGSDEVKVSGSQISASSLNQRPTSMDGVPKIVVSSCQKLEKEPKEKETSSAFKPQAISNLSNLLASPEKAAESHEKVVEKLFTSPLTALFAPTIFDGASPQQNKNKTSLPQHKIDTKEKTTMPRKGGILDGLLAATTSSISLDSSAPQMPCVEQQKEKKRGKEGERNDENANVSNNPSLPDSPNIFPAKESQNALFGRLVASEIDKLPEGLHNIVRAEVLLLIAQATSATSNFNFGLTSSLLNGDKPFANIFGYNC